MSQEKPNQVPFYPSIPVVYVPESVLNRQVIPASAPPAEGSNNTISLYNIIGMVTAKKWKKGESSIFTVCSVSSGKRHEIICPFFCPAREHDSISGICTAVEEGRKYVFIREPVVEPGSSKDAIMTAFIIALKPSKGNRLEESNFGKIKAERLYGFFETEARRRIAEMPIDIHDTVQRNRDVIPQAVLEIISLYAERYRTNESTIQPLVNTGLSDNQAKALMEWWYSQCSMRRLYLMGLTWTEINESILRGWTINELYYQLIENPFVLEKISLEKARNIASRYALTFSKEMLASAELVRFIDKECMSRGWAAYPIQLLNQFQNVSSLFNCLRDEYKCAVRFDSIYLRHQDETENILSRFLRTERICETYPSERTKRALCAEQIIATTASLNHNVVIIDGGAGTGKTTVIKYIAEELDLRARKYIIAAFTGKAVARIKQVFGRSVNAMTLHMLLNKGPKVLDRIDYVIIDEISMVPSELLSRILLKLNDYNTRDDWLTVNYQRKDPLCLTMVGDSNQIPPIEPGDLFNQLLKCSHIARIQLLIDHRRNNDSILKSNTDQFALRNKVQPVGQGQTLPPIHFKFGHDCQFVHGGISEIEGIVRSLFSNGVKSADITVICPYNQYLDELNFRCQNIYIPLPVPQCIDQFAKTWKLGARVMMLSNRYDIDVMNGEEGVITTISPCGKYITAEFVKGTPVNIPTFLPEDLVLETYTTDETKGEIPLSTKCITLSSAITTHKSQGSEWLYVILYLPSGMKRSSFLNRNLFYTAISRARDCLYIVGESASQVDSIIQLDPPSRYDMLASRLCLDNGPTITELSPSAPAPLTITLPAPYLPALMTTLPSSPPDELID